MWPLSEETHSCAVLCGANADAPRQRYMEEVVLLHQEERERNGGGLL